MRGLILGLAVGLAVLLTSGEGRAEGQSTFLDADEPFLNGSDLYRLCEVAPGETVLYCFFYIQGVYDAGEFFYDQNKDQNKRFWEEGGALACVPDFGVNIQVLYEAVMKRLREHRDKWAYSAASHVAVAFEQRFPCR